MRLFSVHKLFICSWFDSYYLFTLMISFVRLLHFAIFPWNIKRPWRMNWKLIGFKCHYVISICPLSLSVFIFIHFKSVFLLFCTCLQSEQRANLQTLFRREARLNRFKDVVTLRTCMWSFTFEQLFWSFFIYILTFNCMAWPACYDPNIKDNLSLHNHWWFDRWNTFSIK